MFDSLVDYFKCVILSRYIQWLKPIGEKVNRFDNYTPDYDDFEKNGLVCNEFDWTHSTPNLSRNENVFLTGSNSIDKSALILLLKWRPHSDCNIANIITKLIFEADGEQFEYDNTTTYAPTKSRLHPDRVTTYGHNGSELQMTVIHPYVKYRLVFSGLMRRRGSPNELKFVKFNMLLFSISKIYDFQEEYDNHNIASQLAKKRPKCGPREAFEQLILHDRHEHMVKFFGTYSISDLNESICNKEVHMWGFHAREFVNEDTQKIRSKRVFGHFEDGRAFHLVLRENIRHNFDTSEQLTSGYVSFSLEPNVRPIECCDEPVDWDDVTGDSVKLSFKVAGHGLKFKVEAERRDRPSEFFDMTMNEKKKGWGVVIINDALDSSEELMAITASTRQYKQDLDSGSIIDPRFLLDNSTGLTDKKEPLVVSIDESEAKFSGLVGAKGSSLAQLWALKKKRSEKQFDVSPAVMLTRFSYDLLKVHNPNFEDQIKQLIATIGRGNLSTLTEDCDRLQKADVKLPEKLKTELCSKMKEMFNMTDVHSLDGRRFAVRSSSWGEDEDDMSAAGQLDTILGVSSLDSLESAVIKCFLSKFCHANIEYKRQHGLHIDLPMGIVVQEMVDCDKAGVLFTCDPSSGNRSIMNIAANYGLGESVVSGKTDPDSIKVKVISNPDKQHELSVEEIKIGLKTVIVTKDNVNNEKLQSGDYQRDKCCISDEEILRLAKCGLVLASYSGCPRDIEWGFKGEKLYLFQSRPITGLYSYNDQELLHESDHPSKAEKEYVTRANVGEVIPYAASPLGLSLMMKLFKIPMFEYMISVEDVDSDAYTLYSGNATPIDCYHFFFGLRAVGFLNFVRYGNSRPLIARALEVGIFGHEVNNNDLEEQATDMFMGSKSGHQDFYFNKATWKQRFFSTSMNRKTRQKLIQLRSDVCSLRFSKSGDSMDGLFDQIATVVSRSKDVLNNHFKCTMLSSKFNFSVVSLLSKYIPDDPVRLYATFAKFLLTNPDIISAEIPRSTERMIKLISKRGVEEIKAFAEMTPKEGLAYVSRDLKSELAKEFDSFMAKFGHRCYNEFELRQPPWRDEPEKIIEMLQANAKAYLNKQDKTSTVTTSDIQSEPKSLDDIMNSLDIKISKTDRLKLKYLLSPRSRQFVASREQTKDNMIYFVDIVRDSVRILARAMRQNNRIPDEDLFYYLFFDELQPLIREPQPSIVMQALRRRRLFKTSLQGPWLYDEIEIGYSFKPKHMRPSKELDEKIKNAPKLNGTTASPGRVQGKVCIIQKIDELSKVESGNILVAVSTDIGYTPIFPLVSGVITEVGGLISHGAVVAREFGLPSVIGIPDVTKILDDGEEIILDADNGNIIRLSQS